MASEIGTKRPLEEAVDGETDAKKPKIDGADKLASLRRQIEYYLSDDNLKHDAFFHKIITNDPEGWLPVEKILTCKKIQALTATAEDIIECLKDSDLVVKTEEPQGVRRTTPPPTLEPRPPREGKEGKGSRGKKGGDSSSGRSDNYHAAGCIIKIVNLPEEASWQTVKEELLKRLPPPRNVTLASGKEVVEQPIQFVGTPSPKGECWALLAPFDNDQDTVSKWEPITINGQDATVELAREWEEIKNFVNQMPQGIKRRREAEILKKKRNINSRPIKIGGQTFSSVNHLQTCLKEVLNRAATSEKVNEKTQQVLRELLAYHPNGATKLQNCTGFTVDMPANSEWNRCFFVVKEDGSTEDFSLMKCFQSLSKNPPFAEESSETKTAASTATTTAASAAPAPAASAAPAAAAPAAASAAAPEKDSTVDTPVTAAPVED